MLAVSAPEMVYSEEWLSVIRELVEPSPEEVVATVLLYAIGGLTLGVVSSELFADRLSEYNNFTCPFSPILKDTSPGSIHIVSSFGKYVLTSSITSPKMKHGPYRR